MNQQIQWLFENPLSYAIAFDAGLQSEPEVPDFMTQLPGGGKPIQVSWQPLKILNVFSQSPIEGIVGKESKGVFIIYKNGQAIYAGAGGVHPQRRGGTIYQELSQYARALRLGASKTDRFTVRVGLVTSRATPQRVKTVENLTIHDINQQLKQQKKRSLANRKDLKPFQVKKLTKVIHKGNLPPHLAQTKSQGQVRRTLRPGKSYEFEGEWLFEPTWT